MSFVFISRPNLSAQQQNQWSIRLFNIEFDKLLHKRKEGTAKMCN